MVPDMCPVCKFEGLDLESECGNQKDRDQRRKRRESAFEQQVRDAHISLADSGLRSLKDDPDLHAAFKRRLVDRFERQTGKRWHEVKITPKDRGE